MRSDFNWRSLAPFISLLVLGAAGFAMHRLLAGVSYHALLAEVQAIPIRRALLALLFTLGSFAALSGYDWLALRHIQRELPWRFVMLVSFCSYAISNTVGFGALSGGSVRYRLYSPAGIDTADIARIALYNLICLSFGLIAVVVFATVVQPELVASFTRLSATTVTIAAYALLCSGAGVVAAARLSGGSLRVSNWSIRLPQPAQVTLPLVISVVDICCAGACLYVLIAADIPFAAFLSVYAVALLVGMLSQIPGGFGTFEAVMLAGLHGTAATSTIAAALVGYRIIYYVVPLAIAAILIAWREVAPHLQPATATARQLAVASRRLIPSVLGATMFVNGAVLLLSTATPGVPHRMHLIPSFVPLSLVEASSLLASIAGSALLIVARGVYRKLNGAYVLALLLCLAGSVFALLKGFDYEEALLLAASAAALFASRRQFYRKTALLDAPFSTGTVVSIAAVLITVFWFAQFSYKHIEYAGTLWWRFEYHAEASRSLRAVFGAGVVLLLIAMARLLRPPPQRPAFPTAEELSLAAGIVREQSSVDANLVLMGDKHLLLSESRDAFLMYGVRGSSWIALGDPVGPIAWMEELGWRFRELADAHGGRVAFYQTRPATLPVYLDMGLMPLKLGEYATVPLREFSLEGSHRKAMRYVLARGEREGLQLEIIPSAGVPALIEEFRTISEAWLAHKNTREKRFSLGAFSSRYLANFDVAVLRHRGRAVAFANLLTTGSREEAAIDLMRHAPDAPEDTMMFLLLKLILHFKADGFAGFCLGVAPLSGMEKHPLAPLWHRFGHLLYNRGEHFYNFHGLRAFKEKFDPVWEPRYLVTAGGLNPLFVLTDIAALIAGGIEGVLKK
jgi:phosphatidylglycerol lysyltransferase